MECELPNALADLPPQKECPLPLNRRWTGTEADLTLWRQENLFLSSEMTSQLPSCAVRSVVTVLFMGRTLNVQGSVKCDSVF